MQVAAFRCMNAIRKIIVATDFSEPSKNAVAMAVDLARRLDAELTIVHVWQLPALASASAEYALADMVGPLIDAARDQLDLETSRVKAMLPTVTSDLRGGGCWDQIIETARERKADLIVLGTHGRTGVRRALLGSVAESVVRHSPIPVLAVPSHAPAALELPKSA